MGWWRDGERGGGETERRGGGRDGERGEGVETERGGGSI